MKVAAIQKSLGYDALTVDELFSKLKSSEIDYQTRAKLETPSKTSPSLDFPK